MGDFNINILNSDSDKDTTEVIDTMYASSLYPTINPPTRITATSETLNILIKYFIMVLQKKF